METTDFVEQKNHDDIKAAALSQINLLKKRHEEIKAEMIKILEATRILDTQYHELENEMYQIESEYVNVMKNIVD
jgi:hypothetical protein